MSLTINAVLILSLLSVCSAFMPAPGTHSLSRGLAPFSAKVSQRPPFPRLRTHGRSKLEMMAKKTFKDFDDLLASSEKPVLVDFYAVWCGPCVIMSKELASLSETIGDKVMIVKIDTEKYPNITNKFNVHALPTCILFKDGQPVDRFEGVMKQDQLKDRILSKIN
ncbi:hypothetical protein GUITHDRAFT_138478 [Guillardia theta CCMP2712]|uniref:Thioredoxin domain-containing protein n=2 Tax=Guillardia theta TaxID=55529 RepID=L1JDH2_GUITC|nr:hypothetical protein GUITHDRAFT_138478 [Guillardia theta CCMP2712]EKX46164.1 hypothetical protein GUITHDRAFT_138478 [Guillardia theta CCMP2712]|eukprot:XP_005833144.1 hypothetical protein GUITHDRAFT_138478 [Guillardia theta CCMP2712]